MANRIVKAGAKGVPGVPLLAYKWQRINKPMRKILSVRTLSKVDAGATGSKGLTAAQSRELIDRAGVGTRKSSSVTRVLKANPITTGTRKGRTVVTPPRPSGKGGVQNPYKQR